VTINTGQDAVPLSVAFFPGFVEDIVGCVVDLRSTERRSKIEVVASLWKTNSNIGGLSAK
jgi:hypothetical protein